MKKVYIDITQAYSWKGDAAGIIRVMDEISSRFVGDSRFETSFLVWDESKACFYDVDYVQALSQRILGKEGQKNEVHIEETGLFHAKPVKAGRKVAAKAPVIGSTYRALRSLKDKIVITLDARKIEPINLQENSVLFMPHGGVWGSKNYDDYILKIKSEDGIKLVPIIYDLCPILTPQFCSKGIRKTYKNYMEKTLEYSDLVLAISKNTQSDVKSWLRSMKKSTPPIEVFRLGDEIGDGEATQPQQKLPKEFILCVGTIEARKNHMGLYYAYELARQKGIDLPPLVIAGRRGWLAKDFYEIIKTDPTIKNRFIFMHNMNDKELAWLYENCLFSVYPAFYEGWGLPVAESLLRGVPVLTSNTSSIPEIAGDLLEYFSPYSSEEIMLALNKYYSNPKILATKTAEIKKKYKPTLWDESYRQVSDFLYKLN